MIVYLVIENGKIFYKISLCVQKNVNVKNSIERHIQSKHKGICYSYDHCEYIATRKSLLKTHIQSKHEGVRYSCDQCDYKTTSKSQLGRHIKAKHEKTQYSCDQC